MESHEAEGLPNSQAYEAYYSTISHRMIIWVIRHRTAIYAL